ncbi:MAG: non-canonical purine NTP pyrophosphatase, partial [Lachnospiraceae bacterium]|nr:non-canonical purine NTP pyrophosphatase [Lachnospiraceae bacterium]
MKRILFATGNKDKVREIREILAGTGIEIMSLKEAGFDIDIEENGTTFEENAAIKAKTAAEMSGEIALADDSGLMIDAFDGGPGVYSARFLGHDTSYEEKNDYILEKLKDVPD